MAKILLAYRRNGRTAEDVVHWKRATKVLDRVLAVNQSYRSPPVNLQNGGDYLYIFNPVESCILREDFHLCIGSMVKPIGKWWESERVANAPLTIVHKKESIFIYADVLGSRTLWFYQDDSLFLASTSQRAMVIYLRSFNWNPQAATWMLATGCTGPGYSWDNRLQALGAGGFLRFNKKSGALEHRNIPISFSSSIKQKDYLKEEMASKLIDSINVVDIDLSEFILTLSGGYDSRAVLNYLKKKVAHTMSWGLRKTLQDHKSDAYIAKRLSEHLQIHHSFLETDQRKDYTFESIVDNFINAGEGRVDHIQTHTDGLEMWSRLANEKLRGVIRADEVFGWLPVQNELDTRLSLAFNYLDDFANLKSAQEYGLEPQRMPDFYRRQVEESLEDWRDRLYQQYRITYIQAGLHELVHPFVELVNPLLLDNIVSFTHTLPSHWRTSKRLYAEIVEEMVPEVPFATKPSIPEVAHITQDPKVVQMMQEEVKSTNSQRYISSSLIQEILPHLKTNAQVAHQMEANWKIRIKQAIPFKIKKILRHGLMQYRLDYNQLMFRNYLITKVAQKMGEDSQTLRNHV